MSNKNTTENKWNKLNPVLKNKILKIDGYSPKYVMFDFDELTTSLKELVESNINQVIKERAALVKEYGLSENYRLGSVTLNLDYDCNMIIAIDGCEQFNARHDWEEGYKMFAKLAKQEDIGDWEVERFWGWKEFGGGLGTPEDNGYGRIY